MNSEKRPNPVDIHVGTRLRLRRRRVGLTQQRLGAEVNITFQQIQKYECGTNRISASKLYEFSHSLRVPITYFFDGYSTDGANDYHPFPLTVPDVPFSREVLESVSIPECSELVEAYAAVKSLALRRKVMALLRSLASD